ncbi:MAG TPA: phosphatase domain-containing protein [Oligoflexus sp.]|uniref:phosphatase domain-containing protein n=1 Tax=Oligoflexus sp. TaxID=1971216 RepID=UPI002D2D423B|nr:phosphatase domain-containing protein [Oligoflexus sp.]HYX39612.1 phosphatase domain-containing protein [Oligoflexus sp.]
MNRFWRGSRSESTRNNRSYNVNSLIDTESLLTESAADVQIICDIDKTYIETRFESAVGMIKIAFEDADAKVAVNGAPLALLTARWGAAFEGQDILGPRPLHFLSASPPQLRRVIRDKLAKDGMDWTSDTFKNQAYNLKMGRLKLLKQHVAYKTATILNHMAKAPAQSKFILIGDNAELDAFIYCGVQMLLTGELTPAGYREYLSLGKVEHEVLNTLEPLITRNFGGVQVMGILIRKAPGYVFNEVPPLTDMALTFDSYFEVIMHFLAWNLCPASSLPRITRLLHNDYGLAREELLACLAQAQIAFTAMGRDVKDLKTAEDFLRRGPPLGTLPNRTYLRPGQHRDRVDLDEKSILGLAKDWVKAIEERE